MKSENNKNWQHRKNTIGDAECQESEIRKGKWHKRKCWTIILGSAFLWPLTTFFIVFFNQHRDVTFINLALGLLAINMYGAQNETYIEGWEKKASNLLIYKRLCKI